MKTQRSFFCCSHLEKLEHFLANPVNFAIMSLFALANTNILFEERMAGELLSNLGMGIVMVFSG